MSGFFLRFLRKDKKPSSGSPRTPSSSTADNKDSTSSTRLHPTPRPPEPVPVWPRSSARWDRLYDVYVCHSEEDSELALQMLAYLETHPEKLRCFLPMRDMQPGSPITSEMCHGVESSHCWVMLLTSHFLSDSWCRYQMHLALGRSPDSAGRFIPVMMNLPRSQYPPEVGFMYYIKGAPGDTQVFSQVRKWILAYLKKLANVASTKHSQSSSETQESSNTTCERTNETLKSSSATCERTNETLKSSSATCERTNETQESSSTTCERTNETLKSSSATCGRSSEAQESSSATCGRSSEAQESSSATCGRSSEAQESSSATCGRSSEAQESSSATCERTNESQESSSATSLRSCRVEEFTLDT